MRKWTALSAIVFLLVIPARSTFAWIDCGHKIVALVAWEDVTPKAKAAVAALLRQHPQYEKELLSNVPKDAGDVVSDRDAFATAATWPDIVRNQNNPMHTLYSHPTWHYIDLPVYEGYGDPSTRPAAKDEKGTDGQPGNAIEAIQLSIKQLKDDSVKASDRAIAMCWLEHVIGDIHQPLHAASMISPMFPDGDAGGNNEVILSDPPYPNSREALHLFWDKTPGEYKSFLMDGYIAAGVRSDPQYTRDAMKSLLAKPDLMDWVKESHDLAETQAYLDGKLKFLPQKKGIKNEPGSVVPGLPADYIMNAEIVAAHQVALGGYRLADVINSIFDPAK